MLDSSKLIKLQISWQKIETTRLYDPGYQPLLPQPFTHSWAVVIQFHHIFYYFMTVVMKTVITTVTSILVLYNNLESSQSKIKKGINPNNPSSQISQHFKNHNGLLLVTVDTQISNIRAYWNTIYCTTIYNLYSVLNI